MCRFFQVSQLWSRGILRPNLAFRIVFSDVIELTIEFMANKIHFELSSKYLAVFEHVAILKNFVLGQI